VRAINAHRAVRARQLSLRLCCLLSALHLRHFVEEIAQISRIDELRNAGQLLPVLCEIQQEHRLDIERPNRCVCTVMDSNDGCVLFGVVDGLADLDLAIFSIHGVRMNGPYITL
jgi:hypothetical protein